LMEKALIFVRIVQVLSIANKILKNMNEE
jgi:hypothetical protein